MELASKKVVAIILALSCFHVASATAAPRREYYSEEEVNQLIADGENVDLSRLEGEVYSFPFEISLDELDSAEIPTTAPQGSDEVVPEQARAGGCKGTNYIWEHPSDSMTLTYWSDVRCLGNGYLPLRAQAGLEQKQDWLRFLEVDRTPIDRGFGNVAHPTNKYFCENLTPHTYRMWVKIWAGDHYGFAYGVGGFGKKEIVLDCA